MKYLNCFLLTTVIFLCSCQTNENVEGQLGIRNFPKSMVGVWKSDRFDWMIKFEEDGSIKKMKHMLAGESNVKEGGVYFEGQDEGTYAMFVYGPCITSFDKNIVNVKVTLDRYEIQLPSGKLIGKTEDYFTGETTKNGTEWIVKWRSYGWLEGADTPNKEEIEKNPAKLVFTKINIDEINKESK